MEHIRLNNGAVSLRRMDPTMKVEAYNRCQDCGHDLENTTVYRRHAYCPDCSPMAVS